jgi:tRNA nucleotidyltransferase (CCA-adding enzyme)
MQIITTHKNTDFDALASVIAAGSIFPEAVAVLPRVLNPNVRRFLSLNKYLFDYRTVQGLDIEKATRLIVVDTNNWQRLDGMGNLKAKQNLEVLLFDHHGANGDIKTRWSYCGNTGANITLMLRHLKKIGTSLSPVQANLFLLGLYEDTGNLAFPSTTAEDAKAAAYLLEIGADLKVLNAFLGPAYSRRQKDILFDMLQSGQRTVLQGVTTSIVTMQVNEYIENLALVVQMYRQVLNVEVAFGLFILPGERCLVIGRSSTVNIDIGNIMRCMGGGGHPGAGSAMVKSVNAGVVAAWIRILIGESTHKSRSVLDLMSTPVFSLSVDMTIQEAFTALKRLGHHGAPVVANKQIVGVLSLRDLRKLHKKSHYKLTVKAFMSTQVITIGPEESVAHAAHLMAKYDIGRLPVVANGQLAGIITRSDAMHDFYGYCPLSPDHRLA